MPTSNTPLFEGIDLSQYTPTSSDFVKAKASGKCDFAILKAGSSYRIQYGITAQGNNTAQRYNGYAYIPANFDGLYNACKNAGVYVGAFWFTYANTMDQFKRDAEMFLLSLQGKKFEFPVYLDLESAPNDGYYLNKISDLENKVATFLQIVSNAGYYTGVYLGINEIKNYAKNIKDSYTLWLANWTGTDYSGQYDMWQWTSKGRVNGLGDNTNVDLDHCYTDFPSIIKLAGKNGYTPGEASSDPDVNPTVKDDKIPMNGGFVKINRPKLILDIHQSGLLTLKNKDTLQIDKLEYDKNGWDGTLNKIIGYDPKDDEPIEEPSEEPEESEEEGEESIEPLNIERPKLKLYLAESGLMKLTDEETVKVEKLVYDETAWDGTLNAIPGYQSEDDDEEENPEEEDKPNDEGSDDEEEPEEEPNTEGE